MFHKCYKQCLISYFLLFINKYTPHSHSNHTLSFGVDLTILLIQEHRVVRILCIQSLSFKFLFIFIFLKLWKLLSDLHLFL